MTVTTCVWWGMRNSKRAPCITPSRFCCSQLLKDDCNGVFVVGPAQPDGDRVLSINAAALRNKGAHVMGELARHVWPPDTNKDDWACSGENCDG